MGLILSIEPIFFKMKFKLLFIVFFFISFLCASEELNRGKEIAENICSVCHGVNGQANTGGNSVLVPHLTAQNEQYLIEKLKHYKDKTLEHHQMSLIADMLTLEDIKNVSKWYSSIKITIQDLEN
jgi:cytochrome c553